MADRTNPGDVANAFVRCMLDDIAAMYGGSSTYKNMTEIDDYPFKRYDPSSGTTVYIDPYSGKDLDDDIQHDHIISNNQNHCGLSIFGNVVKTTSDNNSKKSDREYCNFIKEDMPGTTEQKLERIQKIKDFQEEYLEIDRKMRPFIPIFQKQYVAINELLKNSRNEYIKNLDFKTGKLNEQLVANNKNTVFGFLAQNGIDIDDQNDNYKIIHSDNGKYRPSTPPSLECLKKDWWLILNDTNKCKIHIFLIPKAEKIYEKGKRNKKGDGINFNIYEKGGEFRDTNSKICFDGWLEKSLDY